MGRPEQSMYLHLDCLETDGRFGGLASEGAMRCLAPSSRTCSLVAVAESGSQNDPIDIEYRRRLRPRSNPRHCIYSCTRKFFGFINRIYDRRLLNIVKLTA